MWCGMLECVLPMAVRQVGVCVCERERERKMLSVGEGAVESSQLREEDTEEQALLCVRDVKKGAHHRV